MVAKVSKPFSAPSERNREPILATLRDYFADPMFLRYFGNIVGFGSGIAAALLTAIVAPVRWPIRRSASARSGASVLPVNCSDQI